MTGPSVLACGLTTLDLVQLVDRVPGPDEKLVASGLLVSSGGPAANAAVTATALGAPARLVSRVGSGSIGRLAAEDLAAHGVALIDLAGPGDSPAVSTVLVTASTGERAVVSVNATLTASGGGDPWHPHGAAAGSRLDEALDGIAAVLVDGHHLDLALPLVAAARARGILVLLDGGSWKPGLDELLAQVDVAVLSADFALPGLSAGESSLVRVAALGPVAVARSHGPAPIELLADGALVTVEVPADRRRRHPRRRGRAARRPARVVRRPSRRCPRAATGRARRRARARRGGRRPLLRSSRRARLAGRAERREGAERPRRRLTPG